MRALTNLVPHFILDNQKAGMRNGRFPAVCLFADISGFSTVTNAIVAHGHEAAEVMADIMQAIFEPMVDAVYAHGGYITTFAGDAFTAVFPSDEESEDSTTPTMRSLAAAVAIQQSLIANPVQETDYGRFPFSVKVGLAAGEVEWGILLPNDELAHEIQAAYYFRGTAIDAAAQAEHHAPPGTIVLTATVSEGLADVVQTMAVGEEYVRLLGVTDALPSPKPLPAVKQSPGQERFIPQAILNKERRGEFRQVVSVFVNLMGIRSAADLALFVQAVFGLQAEYGGFLARVDFGDKGANLLLFWGMPTSHEDDINRALSFIYELADVTPGSYKAGITYRPMYAGLAGSARRGEYSAYGGGVSYAARLMVQAPWGSVWLDERVAQRAGKHFVVADEGAHGFKGFAEPQPVYSLVERQEGALADFFHGELIGRQSELARLAAFIRPLLDAQGGKRFAGILVVQGEAGVGKSRLVTEFFTGPLAESCQFFIAQTNQTVRSPFNPFRYWLRRYFEQSASHSESRNKRAFGRRLNQLIGFLQTIETKEAQTLIENLDYGRSFLGALVGLRWENSRYSNLEATGRHEWTATALKGLILAESLRRPLIFNLEDAQWLDSESIDFVQRLVRQIEPYPLAIVVTARPTTGAKPLFGSATYETIDLALMSDDELIQLATNLLTAPLHEELAQLLCGRAEGNPFFTEQIVPYLQEEGRIENQDGVWHLVGEEHALPLPTDVRAIFTARLDQLTHDVKGMVQTAAILGREFEVQILAHMLQGDEALPAKIAAAEDAAIWRMLTQLRCLFKHSLLRDAAYEMQLRARRRELHYVAAQAMEALQSGRGGVDSGQSNDDIDDIALHYETAYQQGLSKARQPALLALKQAAQWAADNYENEAAVDSFSRALALLPAGDDATRYELLLGRESIYALMGQRSAQARDLETLVALTDPLQIPSERTEVTLRRARMANAIGDYSAAQGLAQQAVKLAQTAGDVGQEAAAQLVWGDALRRQGVYDAAREHLQVARQLSQAAKQLITEARALNFMGIVANLQGKNNTAEHLYQKSLAIHRAAGNRAGEGWGLNNLGILAVEQGDYEKAQHLFEESLTFHSEVGNRVDEGRELYNLGWVATIVGDYGAAQHLYEESLTVTREVDNRADEARLLNSLGWLAAILGDYMGAQRLNEESLVIARQIGDLQQEGYALTGLGEALGHLGEAKTAQKCLLKAINLRQKLNSEVLVAESKTVLADLYYRHKDLAKARELIADVQAYWLNNGNFNGAESPLRILLICHQVLQATAEPQAGEYLQHAYDQLQEQAGKLSDTAKRQTFLENVSWNRAIIAAYADQVGTGEQGDTNATATP